MRKFCSILPVLFLLMPGLVAICLKAQAQVAPADRITQPVESSRMAPLVGSVHPTAKAEFDQGLADNSKVITGMTMNFSRTAAQEANLKELLQAQQDPSSPRYHKWLTPAQFGQQFGMSAADLTQVSAWLQQQGFTIATTSESNNAIWFSGSIASLEKAFKTQIHNYRVNGEMHFANATQISVPSAFAATVSSVRGLDDFRLKPRIQRPHKLSSALTAHFTDGLAGDHNMAPGDFATIYDLSPLTGGAPSFGGTYTGKGINIAITGQTDIVASDITDFRAAAGLPANPPVVFTVPGSTPESATTGAGNDDLAETDLDLEWSGAVAPGASITLINSGDVRTSLQYVAQNTVNGAVIPIISQSYGQCEATVLSADLTTSEAYLEQANTQGQTIVTAAGDTGAADCDSGTSTTPSTSAANGLAVDYPGSSAFVTGVGGSEFMGDGTAASPQTGSGQYWSATGSGSVNDDLITSAKSYIPEMGWNDTTFAIANGGGLSAGGGGASALFKTKPTWQTGVAGIPADGDRDVPDISLDASPDHDGYLYCTQVTTQGSPNAFVSSCQATSFRLSDSGQQDNNSLNAAGGTSFSAPAFAGILAVLEQKLSAGGGQGNINPSLYSLAANATTYASAFHDITTGNNQVPCTTGSPNCPSGSNPVIGYVAGTGYDQVTGLGSLDVNNFVTAYTALIAATGTATTLTASPGTSLAINESVTFTATVAPNTLSAAPTGTVTFIVDGVSETPVALSTAAPFTTSFKTTFPTAGTHVVSATYSGDSTYKASTSTAVTLAIVASGTEATTTTVTANPTTIPLGSALTLTATVSGATAGTLTGPVTFTTGGVTIGTVKQVTLAAGNTATATLSVAAATTSLGFVAGTDTITATYGGDSFNATSSGTTTVMVTNPGITVTATNITISSASPGHSGTSTITLTSTGSYTGTATVTAAASSLNADYGFGSGAAQTASVALASDGTGTTTLTITTIAATGNVQKGLGGNFLKNATRIAAAGGTAAGCILLLLIPGIRRKRWPVALAMLVFLSVGAGLGCGGGTGGGAPKGTYTVTVTATDSSNSSIVGSGTFTVTIQ